MPYPSPEFSQFELCGNVYTVQFADPPTTIGLSTWAEAEKRAIEEGGWVAFKTDQSIAPVARQPGQLSPFETMTTRPTTASIFVSTQPDAKRKSLAAEVLPFLALVIGIPLIVWWTDKKQKESFRRR